MTTNKPGSDQQQPLYGCVSCFEYQTFPDDHLRVYDGNCYCEDCWDAYPADADIEWTSLGSFTPALQAECDQLRKDAERLDWLDAQNAPFRMGWKCGIAPAGNVQLHTVIQLGASPAKIRDAVDAAMQGDKP